MVNTNQRILLEKLKEEKGSKPLREQKSLHKPQLDGECEDSHSFVKSHFIRQFQGL
jgi:hypothetical protein